MMSSPGDKFQTIAGYLGNVMEWYDFAIYGFFSDTLSEVFFPPSTHDNAHLNLILSYVVFGGAFLMRPIGGIVSGHIGDMLGRKQALVFSLLSMTIPTVGMGCLPSYKRAGGWSTALLVICRLLQGFSAGGQLPSSVVYSLEMKPKEHWGYYGSLISFSMGMGSVLGNLTGALIRTLLTEDQLVSWGWRIAFFTGILIAPVGGYLHYYGDEIHPNDGVYHIHDPQADDAEKESISLSSRSETSPLREACKRENWAALCTALLTPMLGGAGHYTTFVWMPVFMTDLIDSPVKGAFWINLVAMLVGHNTTAICIGLLSDTFGRTKFMVTGAISTGLLAPVLIWVISRGQSLDAFFAQFALGALLSLYTGPLYAWLPERFPPAARLTSAALGYNIGICLSAGFTPAIATALTHIGPVAPSVIYPFFAAIALVGMWISTRIPHHGHENNYTPTQSVNTDTDSLAESKVPLVFA